MARPCNLAADLGAARALVVQSTVKHRETGPAAPHVDRRFRSFLPAFGEAAMEFVDRVLKCNDCGAEFVFTAGEQLFFHDKQFKNDPKHCKQCKAKRASGGRVRSETRTTCSACGTETTVPFKPTQGRPVLCRACFQKQVKPAAAPVAKNPAPLAN
jgi:CxxC-x17-CxxC domain-containing protein